MSTTQKRIDKIKKQTRGDSYQTQEEKNSQLREKEQAREKHIRSILNQTFGTDAGKQALQILMELCGYDNYDAVARTDAGVIDMTSSFYNSARRSVYIDIRKYINHSTLIETEHQP